MVTINFFPWRNYERRYHFSQLMKLLTASISFALLSLTMMHFAIKTLQQQLQVEVNKLEAQNQLLLAQHKTQVLLQQKPNQALTRLLKHETSNRTLFANFSINTSTQLCFEEVMRKASTITFTGKAATAADLSLFLKSWQAMPLFSEVKINSLEAIDSQRLHFELVAQERDE